MHKQERKNIQLRAEEKIRQERNGSLPITKMDSLNDRAKKLRIAIDLPGHNRSDRRLNLTTAVHEERKKATP